MYFSFFFFINFVFEMVVCKTLCAEVLKGLFQGKGERCFSSSMVMCVCAGVLRAVRQGVSGVGRGLRARAGRRQTQESKKGQGVAILQCPPITC